MARWVNSLFPWQSCNAGVLFSHTPIWTSIYGQVMARKRCKRDAVAQEMVEKIRMRIVGRKTTLFVSSKIFSFINITLGFKGLIFHVGYLLFNDSILHEC